MTTRTLTIEVGFDPDITDVDAVGVAVDNLLETAMSTPGILDEYGNPDIGQTYVHPAPGREEAVPLFDAITGASYFGFGFRQILLEDPQARAAAQILVDRLRQHGAKGLE